MPFRQSWERAIDRIAESAGAATHCGDRVFALSIACSSLTCCASKSSPRFIALYPCVGHTLPGDVVQRPPGRSSRVSAHVLAVSPAPFVRCCVLVLHQEIFRAPLRCRGYVFLIPPARPTPYPGLVRDWRRRTDHCFDGSVGDDGERWY